jgi:anaerobic ribonucleoside-triphosphate reductase activating protein
MMLRLAGIVKESVVDGPGIRMVIFVQGCRHHCPGCHNPATQDLTGGYDSTVSEVIAQLPTNSLVSGVTFSGGEPFLQAGALAEIGRVAKQRGLSIFTYTGFVFETLLEQSANNPDIAALLAVTDVLIDGPFLLEQRDISLAYRGSSNQRLIDLPASLQQGKPVEWTDPIWVV